MSAILKFDFQKREQLRFSEVNYLNYTKKDPILHVATTFSRKQGGNKNKSWTHSTPLKFTFMYTQLKVKGHHGYVENYFCRVSFRWWSTRAP